MSTLAQLRAKETIRLLAESPMGIRVKSTVWLRSELHLMAQEVVRLTELEETVVRLMQFGTPEPEWDPDE